MALDSLSNVKARLGISSTEYDSFLTAQIQLISDVIESYCGRVFSATDWVQTFHRLSTRRLVAFHYPIISVASLEEDGVPFPVGKLFIHRPTGTASKDDFSRIRGEVVTLSYRAGYETIPSPILGVLDGLVEERYNKKIKGVDLNFGKDVQRVSIPGSISIDFDYSLSSNERSSAFGMILGSYGNVLDYYRSDRAVIPAGDIRNAAYVDEAP